MKKVLIDSSIWVSYFLKNKAGMPVFEKVNKYLDGGYTIMLPEMVYVETRNALKRLGLNESRIRDTYYFFKRKKIFKISVGDSKFWFQKTDEIRKLVHLNTQDLIIVTHALVEGVEELYTGDKKLHDAFTFLRQRYEKENSQK